MRHVNRYLIVAILTFVVLLGTFAAASAQDKIPLKIWSFTDDPTLWDELVADFNAANPDIEATWEGRTTDGHKEAMRQVINTSAAPDIFHMYTANGVGLGGYYIQAGGVEPLDQFYEQYNWAPRFSEAGLAGSTYDGHLYGIPFRIRTMGLFYAKAAFEKAGITAEPTTYDELTQVNDQLVAAGITPLTTGGQFNWMPMRLVDSLMELECGPEKHDELKAMIANWAEEPCVTAAYTELKRWNDSGWLPANFLGISPNDAAIPLYRGEAAYIYDGDWMPPRLPDNGQRQEDYGFFYFPTGDTRISFFAEILYMTNTSQHKPEAARFLDFVSSPEVQQKFAGRFGSLPPTAEVGVPEDAGPLVNEINELAIQATGIYLPADQSLPLDIVNVFWRAQNEVFEEVTPPDQAGAGVQAAIELYMETH